MSSLKLERIEKRFGEKVVIPALDLEVGDGEFVALLGPSGCGKTTLLRMVAGLEQPSAGRLSIGSREVFAAAASGRGNGVNVPPEERRLGMVFQSYAVWPHMTVAENVAYPLKFKKEASRDAAERAMRLVHLEALRDRYPHQLSGGQQQRVALARGLAMEPPVLLLDEPLSNLDARLRAEMRREIRDLHRALKMTILYVTHDQREAFEMSTQVIVMNEGRIAQRGAPDEVRRSPAPGFVAEFLSEH